MQPKIFWLASLSWPARRNLRASVYFSPGGLLLTRRGPVAEWCATGQQGLEKPARRIPLGVGVQRHRQMVSDLSIVGVQSVGAVEQGQSSGNILLLQLQPAQRVG